MSIRADLRLVFIIKKNLLLVADLQQLSIGYLNLKFSLNSLKYQAAFKKYKNNNAENKTKIHGTTVSEGTPYEVIGNLEAEDC